MIYTSELNYNELPKVIYSWMIEEHKKSWTGPIDISRKGETNRGVTVTCDEGWDPEDISRIENYEEAIDDTTQVWHCHHRMETHNSEGYLRKVFLYPEELKSLDMYYHRPANELIFLTISEHTALHNKGNSYSKGKIFSDEHKRKISEARKGKHWKLVDGKRVWY